MLKSNHYVLVFDVLSVRQHRKRRKDVLSVKRECSVCVFSSSFHGK